MLALSKCFVLVVILYSIYSGRQMHSSSYSDDDVHFIIPYYRDVYLV